MLQINIRNGFCLENCVKYEVDEVVAQILLPPELSRAISIFKKHVNYFSHYYD